VSVDIDAPALYSRGLTPTDLVNAIGAQNLILPTGSMKVENANTTLASTVRYRASRKLPRFQCGQVTAPPFSSAMSPRFVSAGPQITIARRTATVVYHVDFQGRACRRWRWRLRQAVTR